MTHRSASGELWEPNFREAMAEVDRLREAVRRLGLIAQASDLPAIVAICDMILAGAMPPERK